MALIIDDPEAERLARELAAVTGESLTEAVTEALRDRLVRVTRHRNDSMLLEDIRRIQEEVRRLPVLDNRTPDEIIGYDEYGLPT